MRQGEQTLTRSRVRQLDDEELDSGDDTERQDRTADEEPEPEFVEQERVTMDLEITRQPVPEPSDGEVRTDVECTDIC